jgi:hypothetical protein
MNVLCIKAVTRRKMNVLYIKVERIMTIILLFILIYYTDYYDVFEVINYFYFIFKWMINKYIYIYIYNTHT